MFDKYSTNRGNRLTLRIIKSIFGKMNLFARYIFLTIVALISFTSSFAQEDLKLLVGADFDTYFDNREYSGGKIGESQTLFSSRLTPTLGVEWNDRNRLVFAMDMWSNFGDDESVFAKARPQIYYRFASEKVRAYAGIFSREEMIGDYSEVFLSDSVRFYENRVQGFMGQYRGDRGFVELSMDWCGMYSEASREKFRVLSAGRYYLDNYHRRFYAGYALQVFHYAGSETIQNCVVDNIIANPYLGARFNAYFDFDVRLHYIQTMQRDRANEDKFRTPKGAMLQLRMEKWGLYLDEQLYLGENMQPYYSTFRSEAFPYGYGGDLYSSERFFGTDDNIYNNTKIGYCRSFFGDTLRVNAYVAMQYDGYKWGNKQVVQLSVRLLKDISLDKKR